LSFMETEGALLSSQEAATGPYPEPNESIHIHILCILSSILILSSHLRVGFPSSIFSSVIRTKTCLVSPMPAYMPRPSHLAFVYHRNSIR
jgi:hypothetical protein